MKKFKNIIGMLVPVYAVLPALICLLFGNNMAVGISIIVAIAFNIFIGIPIAVEFVDRFFEKENA